MPTFTDDLSLALPSWVRPFLDAWEAPLDGAAARMRLAIALAAENVRQGTGGPFGALVVEDCGNRLLGAGINLVTASGLSMAHAEVVAVSLAQRAVATWDLGTAGPAELVTSCEPCAMCYGAVPWSGVASLVWGAGKQDAETAGFDEGDKPAHWERSLENRGIRTRGNVLREEAAAVLADYAHRDGTIYHPRGQ